MVGFAEQCTAILVVTVFVLFTNFVLFFPWYMTLAYETYNLASMLQAIIICPLTRRNLYWRAENQTCFY